ncbi:TAT-variant-translocated molybdopterin oxidoreductase [bacterium]|nr:TAT-variant-translocated molybdopterin oxidoreductase [bacterium]
MPSINKKNMIVQNGKEYWRSLDQLADTPEFKEFVEREFPENASEMTNTVTRRNFLGLMGASIALAGLAGCRRPVEKIIPYVIKPEEIIPGIAEWYATAMPMGLNAYGVLAKSHEGHPTKIEGNEKHPSSLGSSNSFMQSAILGLYDPDRSKFVLQNNEDKTWYDFVTFWRELYNQYKTSEGEGLALISESWSSPSLALLQSQFKKTFPKATWVTYEPVSDENIYEGVKAATGKYYQPLYSYNKARVILSLDSDFLYTGSDNVTAARGFADGRRIKTENDAMNRLYVVESVFSITGGMADHRLRMQSRQIGAFTAALAKELTAQGVTVEGAAGLAGGNFDMKWLSAVAKDLIQSRGKSLVVAGARQPASVHALVYAINSALGNIGNAVSYREMKDAALPDRAAFTALVKKMHDSNVSTLVIMGGNPVYNAPADMEFESAMGKVGNTIHLSAYMDETSSLAKWHIPQAHFLESWGDVRSADGSLSIIQPLIEPLFGGKTALEFLNLVAASKDDRGYDIVRENWKNVIKGDYEKSWRLLLHDGILANSSLPLSTPKIDSKSYTNYLSSNPFVSDSATPDNLEIVFQSSSATFDGRFANNGWLQELPDPVTKITWDNVAMVSFATAQELGLSNQVIKGENKQPVIILQYNGREIELPVWVQPGHADNSVTVTLGYGRTAAGRVGNGVGTNVYALRTSEAQDFGLGLQISKTGKLYAIGTVQDHGGFDTEALAAAEIAKRVPTILREGTLDEYQKNPNFVTEIAEMNAELIDKESKKKNPQLPNPISIYNAHNYDEGYQWGMSIDLNACIGCNACTIACQSENNIPIVGKSQILKGREMHWMRMDRYYCGDVEQPEIAFQPIGCQHCETAPCEQVCPVAATVHDSEGLNVMVYNRCVGTRYCANNCPYKVRRFNFLEFNPGTSGFNQVDGPEILKMSKNPDVSVRMRGVMEKCTYCVQRISGARITAKKENRQIKDGEVVSACQQSCPTQAIVFGNINDPSSKVAEIKKLNRQYQLLAELNTRPRTSYLAKLRNPNPELEEHKNA